MGNNNVKENRAWHARGGRKKKGHRDLMRIRERRNQLNAAVNSSNDIRIELNPPSTEATSPAWNALPTFQAGEIVSVEGDTRGRG